MKNSRKSITFLWTILKNLWKIRRQFFNSQFATADLETQIDLVHQI
jgi:hypothetical protein